MLWHQPTIPYPTKHSANTSHPEAGAQWDWGLGTVRGPALGPYGTVRGPALFVLQPRSSFRGPLAMLLAKGYAAVCHTHDLMACMHAVTHQSGRGSEPHTRSHGMHACSHAPKRQRLRATHTISWHACMQSRTEAAEAQRGHTLVAATAAQSATVYMDLVRLSPRATTLRTCTCSMCMHACMHVCV